MVIINHSYIQMLDVWELEKREGVKKRRTQIIKVYHNHLRADEVWGQVGSTSRRRVLVQVKWNSLLEGSVIVQVDFNTHSPEWIIHCGERWDDAGLEALVEGET